MALLLASLSGSAHNGAVAIAVPVEGIVVDGDLAEWPDGMSWHPIEEYQAPVPIYGDDFTAGFLAGYSESERPIGLGPFQPRLAQSCLTGQVGWLCL